MNLNSKDPTLNGHAVSLGDEGQHLVLAGLFGPKLELGEIVDKEVELCRHRGHGLVNQLRELGGGLGIGEVKQEPLLDISDSLIGHSRDAGASHSGEQGQQEVA